MLPRKFLIPSCENPSQHEATSTLSSYTAPPPQLQQDQVPCQLRNEVTRTLIEHQLQCDINNALQVHQQNGDAEKGSKKNMSTYSIRFYHSWIFKKFRGIKDKTYLHSRVYHTRSYTVPFNIRMQVISIQIRKKKIKLRRNSKALQSKGNHQ